MTVDIDFGTVGAGETSRKSIPDAPIFGGSYTCDDPRFSVSDAIVRQVAFSAQASDAEGVVTATLTQGSRTWSMQATIAHSLTAAASHNYGTLPVSTAAYGSIVVSNRTASEASLVVQGDGFTLASAASLPAGSGPVVVLVAFSRPSPGSYTGTLVATAGGKSATCNLAAAVGDQAPITALEVSATDANNDGTISAAETKTTYKVHVPSSETRFHLGAAVAPFSGIDGFGLRTTAKGLLYATEHIGINSVTGDVRIQAEASDGNVVSVAGGNSVLASGGATYVVGDGGVLITTALDVSTQTTNGMPDSEDLMQASNIAAGVFATLDAFVAGASAARAIATTPWKGTFKSAGGAVSTGLGAVSAGAALVATGLGLASASGSFFGAQVSVPGVTIYGHAGILLGTAGFGGFYSAAGLVLGSVFPVMIGMDAEILGLRSTAITGNGAKVTGWSETTIESGGTLDVVAKTSIDMGVVPSSSPLPWKTAGAATSSMKLEDKKMTILVGKYAVTIDDSEGVFIGLDANGAVDDAKPCFWLDGDRAYMNGPGAENQQSWIEVKDGMAVLNGGKANASQLKLEDNKAVLFANTSATTYVKVDGSAQTVELKATTMKASGTGELKLEGGVIKIG